MRNIYSAARPSSFECEHVFRLDDATVFDMWTPEAPVRCLTDALPFPSGGFVLKSDEFQSTDFMVYGNVQRYLEITPHDRWPLRFLWQTLYENFLIADQTGPFVTIIPEDVVKNDPEQFMTPRLREIAAALPFEKILEYDMGYLIDLVG